MTKPATEVTCGASSGIDPAKCYSEADRLIPVYLDAVLTNLDVDAALAFLVVQVASHNQANGEQTDNQIKNIATHCDRPLARFKAGGLHADGDVNFGSRLECAGRAAGPWQLFATKCVFHAADSVLNLALDCFRFALRLKLCVTYRLPDSFLDFPLDDLRRSDNPILVHGVLLSRDMNRYHTLKTIANYALIHIIRQILLASSAPGGNLIKYPPHLLRPQEVGHAKEVIDRHGWRFAPEQQVFQHIR